MADLDRSNARLRVLAEVSHAFAEVATDYSQLLETIASSAAARVGDGCLVTLVEGEQLVGAATAHRDAALAADYDTYRIGAGPSTIHGATVSAGVVRTGQPVLVPEIDPAALVARTDDALKPLVARLNVHSFAVVPIRVRQAVIGTLSLLRSGPGRGFEPDDLVLLQDLADRAGLAIENARLYDDLERRVRERTIELEAITQGLEAFSYSVAHDLRAPLRSLDGFSLAVLEDAGDRLDPTSRRHLGRVREAAQQMSHLIDDLLELSRVTRAEFHRERIDLSYLARLVADRLRDLQPERAVELVVAPGLEAEADPRLFEVVLTNLIGNAWKFTGKQAAARIEFAGRPDAHPPVYWVRDNGAGFDPTYAKRLFTPFQRLHSAHDFAGTGIGLATVQRIVHRHGGRIWAEGEVDHGATFYFTLADQ